MTVRSIRNNLFNSRRGQLLLENLTAYLFLAPAGLIIFIFGLFPVAFAFFVSLHRWRRFPDEYQGLDQYVNSLGNFAYVVFFWIAIGLIIYSLMTLAKLLQETHSARRGLLFLIPGCLNAAAIMAVINWFFVLLPVVLNVPVRLRGQQQVQGLFVGEFFNSFQFPEPLAAANTMWLFFLLAVIVSILFLQLLKLPAGNRYLTLTTIMPVALISSGLILELTLSEIQIAIDAAREAGESLPIWSQIILISAGAGMLFAAYLIWQRAIRADSNRNLILYGLATVFLVIGGYVLIAELPPALTDANKDILRGFSVTIMYSLGTVPFQLVIGLGLAVLLFQNIKGKSLFRVIYFMPYITPFVATSVVFSLLFSHRTGSPAN
ncbi:MAG TPA: hypothetical protein VHL11_16725, partial [Phototrophicaceae bacterium]|nr:hypothetical protein [Phototrophicaceae bacterium]